MREEGTQEEGGGGGGHTGREKREEGGGGHTGRERRIRRVCACKRKEDSHQLTISGSLMLG